MDGCLLISLLIPCSRQTFHEVLPSWSVQSDSLQCPNSSFKSLHPGANTSDRMGGIHVIIPQSFTEEYYCHPMAHSHSFLAASDLGLFQGSTGKITYCDVSLLPVWPCHFLNSISVNYLTMKKWYLIQSTTGQTYFPHMHLISQDFIT